MTRDSPPRRLCARRLGTKPRAAIAASTFAVRAALTLARPFSTLETVPIDTPALRATSRMVGLFAKSKRVREIGLRQVVAQPSVWGYLNRSFETFQFRGGAM